MRWASAVLLPIVLVLVGHSGALGPPFPFPWFTEHFDLGQLNLPEGVVIEVVFNDGAMFNESIVIRNTSSTVLYVIGAHWIFEPDYDEIPVKLAPGTGPINKLVDGWAYQWEEISTYRDSSLVFAWRGEDNYEHGDSVWLDSDLHNRIISDRGIVVALEPLNQYGGRRPADVNVPDAQTVLLPLVYGTEALSVSLTVSYSLNEDYQPAPPPSILPDSITPEALLGCSIMGLILLVGAIWLALQAIKDKLRNEAEP